MKPNRWLIWGCFLLGWTFLLIFPDPDPFIPSETFTPGRRWLAAKLVHLTGYATLAILSGWLRVPPRYRPLLVLGIMAHCTATEIVQTALAQRDGNLFDVGINNAAVLLGVALSWKWWTSGGNAGGAEGPGNS